VLGDELLVHIENPKDERTDSTLIELSACSMVRSTQRTPEAVRRESPG
jgi:hypothetical protein